MTRYWDCLRGWRTIYTRSEVLRRGWAWHAGTAPAVLALALNCDAPPAVAYGGPLPPLPVHETSPPPTQPAIGSGGGGAYYGPSPLSFLPTPEMFSLPIPAGAFEVTPGVVETETTPVRTQPCYQGQPVAPSYTCDTGAPGTPVSAPEPSTLLVLAGCVAAFAMVRRLLRAVP